MSRHLKNQSGETIVEVIVSFVLLLMFTALFVVSLRYARTMSLKRKRSARRPMHSAKSCTPPEMETPNG
mgnify:CR=1 FL=1